MKTPGQIAYEKYYDTIYGQQLLINCRLPRWEDQKRDVQEAWESAAEAVLNMRNWS